MIIALKNYKLAIVITVVSLSMLSGSLTSRNSDGFPQTGTGTLQGTLQIQSTPEIIRREPGKGYGNSMPGMRGTGYHDNESENVVIYLEGRDLRSNIESNSKHETMNQKDATFIPHVLPILKGTAVDFVNEDNTYHDVFSLSPTKRFNIGRRPTGEVVPVKFDKPGIVEIFCDIHSYMSAYIIVLDNPFFAKPDSHGYFKIENIPPGTYTMKVWHQRLHSEDESVTISPGGTTTVHPVLE